MYRFLAFVWDGTDAHAAMLAGQLALRLQRTGRGWQNVLNAPGVSAFQIGTQPLRHEAYPLPNSAGAIFGKLFEKRFDAPINTALVLSSSEADRIVATRGQH